MNALLPVYVTPYFACSLVYNLTGSHVISPALEIPSISLANRNLSSNRGPGYSPQYGIAPANAWFFPSVIKRSIYYCKNCIQYMKSASMLIDVYFLSGLKLYFEL